MGSILGIKDYILGGIIIALLTCICDLWWQNSSLKDDNVKLNTRIISYEAIAKASQEEAKAKIIYVDKQVEVVKWKTETKIKTIKEYVKDENQSDCSNAMSFARSFF